MMDEKILDRAVLIHRSYSRAKRSAISAAGAWRTFEPRNLSGLMGVLIFLVLLVLEPTLWFDNWLPIIFHPRVPDSVAFWMLSLLLFNGWFVDRFLSHTTQGEARLPWYVRCFRLFAASLPLLGFYAISVWKQLVETQPLKLQATRQGFDLSHLRQHLPKGLYPRQLYRSAFFTIWLVAGYFPLLVWAEWLGRTSIFGAYRQLAILGVCTMLHMMMAAFMAHHLSFHRNFHTARWKGALYSAVPVLLLLSLAGAIAGLLILLFLDSARKPLSSHPYDRQNRANRIPSWQGLQRGLRPEWRKRSWLVQWQWPSALPEPLTSQGHNRRSYKIVTEIYRIRTFILAFESAAVIFMILSYTRTTSFLEAVAFWGPFLAVTLIATGLAGQALGLFGHALGIDALKDNLLYHPYASYLALTQMAFLAGLQGAFLLIDGHGQMLGLLLWAAGMFGAMLLPASFLFTLRGIDLLRPSAMIWEALFVLLMPLGAHIRWEGEGVALSALKLLAITSPLFSLGLFLSQGTWLLRPFSWRHAFDHNLPHRLRAAIAFVTLTAVLPLGGLAIPFWIYARHRLWPNTNPVSPAVKP